MDPNAPSTPKLGRQQLAAQVNARQGEGSGSHLSQLTENPFFTAGFALAAVATAARIGQKGLAQGASYLRRHLLAEIEITRHDQAYPWLLQWMTAVQRAQNTGGPPPIPASPARKSGLLSSLIQRINPRLHYFQIQSSPPKNGPSSAVHFSIVPGQGQHFIRYGSAFIRVNRQREKALDLQTGLPFETITLTTLHVHREVVQQMFAEAHQLHQQRQEGKTVVYTPMGPEWRRVGEPRLKRPLESVVLERGVKERIVGDMQWFLAARTKYLDRGTPYRRGYLLHGPPGTGKSSFIQALAGHLDYNIAMLSVSQRGMTDDRLNHLLEILPPRTVVALEDIDVAFGNRRKPEADGYTGASVTFSGLLNALDGIASTEERIIFMTTNHIERLDDALIRPGRVDSVVELGNATEYQIEGLWDRYYADVDPKGEGKKEFMAKFKENGLINKVSTAALQGLFQLYEDDTEGVIDNVNRFASHIKKKPV